MTKPEAIAAMEAGKKVTHRHFTSDEWATMENGMIFLEDGVKCTPAAFWGIRGEAFNEDWELFEENDTTKHLCNKHGELLDEGAPEDEI